MIFTPHRMRVFRLDKLMERAGRRVGHGWWFLWRKLNVGEGLVDVTIILGWILKKWSGRLLIGFIWFRRGASAWKFVHVSGTSRPPPQKKIQENYWLRTHWLLHGTLIRGVSCIILCMDTQQIATVATSQVVRSQRAGTLPNWITVVSLVITSTVGCWGAKATNRVSVRVIQRHYVSIMLITYQFCSGGSGDGRGSGSSSQLLNYAGNNISALQFQQYHIFYNSIFHDLFPHFTRIIMLSKRMWCKKDITVTETELFRNQVIPREMENPFVL